MALSAKLIISALMLIIGLTSTLVNARRHSPLLVEEDGARRNRPAECLFGRTLRELGSTWFADLGPPFGVMYCIKCECIPVQKKRRIVARVQCRNIKNECPKPTCDEPILLPGRCCKMCPGDLHSPDIVHDLPQAVMPEDEERSKHFAALLTGRTSSILKRDDMKSIYSTINPLNIVATGRFVFHKKNLYYSFYISDKAPRPRAIQFVDNQGNILEEHPLVIPAEGPFSVYQNATGKVCGVWRRVPRDYRRLLRDDMMNVVLLWGGKYQAELAIAGPIGKYPALPQELFSSLLEPAPGTNPEQMNGAGGTAIVSTKSGVTSSIYLTIVLNGVFSSDDIADVPLNIRLEMQNKDQVILEETQRIKKPAHDINIIEVSSPLSVNDLRLLTRGKLSVVVESKRKPEALRIHGVIQTRVACEVFQTLLASHNPEVRADTSGLAWMYLNKEGSLVYNVQTHNLHMSHNPVITLIENSAKRKAELESLGFSSDHVTGVVERMGPRVLEPLYSGDLAINVANDLNPNLIHGKFLSRPVADARDSSAPALLKRAVNSIAPMHSVGMAWMAVDNECILHYEVTLTGIPSAYHPVQLYLEELPIEAVNAPVSRTLLEDFNGNYLEGFVLAMPSTELAKLETSVIYLEIRSKSKDEPILKAKLKSIKVPNHCTGNHYNDNDVQNNSVISTAHNDNNLPTGETKCYHSSRFYDEGEMWQSALESCTMCSCVHKRVKCEPVRCPPLKCKKEDIVQKKGDCCPTCTVSKPVEETTSSATTVRGCNLGDQFHDAGSTWHPYLPPNGYDTCTVCTCDALTLEINCPRTQCPPLNCSDKAAYRPDRKACCKVCPQIKERKPVRVGNPEEMGDQGSINGSLKSTQSILANGGCSYNSNIYENGQEFHPILATHGEQKCVKCSCKDGNIKCERKRCTRSLCNRQHVRKNTVVDECCQCQKTGRHQHKRRQNQQKQHHQQQAAISVKS
ncbi:dorsal-ventral patterning protein Sog [Toxorhynchites rutilus septentrionalis]|uniref:dorsal-ventral patterning protein Sog n=1 Tax=Toxorhynchites rutilus septentrionalis TaxID=329112 RepID=UPI002478E337|nr:dorsal-ventral patterning protein Sog [Toxorhynchites rutilus septentrionalis]XP_055615507.1 dorsal-ventral patterning protein Sog [Toxorhynchites rutilus septentrionalis]